jgi:hypothetical protein
VGMETIGDGADRFEEDKGGRWVGPSEVPTLGGQVLKPALDRRTLSDTVYGD